MARNVGSTDQLVRILLGAVAGLVSIGILIDAVPLPAVSSPVLGVAAMILLVTGVTGFCGLYTVLGVDTCSVEAR
jgi:hypothetical protein